MFTATVKRKSLLLSAIFFFVFSLTGCTSVIDKTKTIELSKKDLREIEASPEVKFIAPLEGVPLSNWQKGRKFVAADDRAALIFTANSGLSVNDHIGGDTLIYNGISSINSLSGTPVAVLNFIYKGSEIRMETSKSSENALKEITGTSLPLLIDLEMVARADSLLRGRRIWTRSGLWYDSDREKLNGKKFVPVIVSSVSPGNINFPLIVNFTVEADKSEASMFMNFRNSGGESRGFPTVFSLSDPRQKYPGISDENWLLIQQGKIRTGMTKLECRLSIGNPASVSPGHDISRTLDFWSYPDGTYIWFQDDIVTNFRH